MLSATLRPALRSQARFSIWKGRGFGNPTPLQQRFASYQYQRFQQQRGFLRAWASQPTFYYQVAGFAGVVGAVYVANLETVPVSGRRRFNIISAEQEAQLAQQQYEVMMQEFGPRILPGYDSRVRQVRKVLSRLIPVSGLEDLDWQVHVVDSPEQNAMVIPGGKVFVFSGLLPVCDGEDGIATVLGHEIAHTVAHHAAERMSSGSILSGAVLLISGVLGFSQIQYSATRIMLVSIVIGSSIGIFTNALSTQDLGFDRPASRRQEEEADYIGLS